jgi:ADP-ribose pyrophosphatase YjhB (NUDIX family)
MHQVEHKIVTCGGCVVVKFINNKANILLVKSPKDKINYALPKGHKEIYETIRDCCIRETAEETGILPSILASLPTVNTTFKTKYGIKTKIVHFYLAVPTQFDAKIAGDGENEEVNFFPIDALPQIISYQLPVINAALNMIHGGLQLHCITGAKNENIRNK